jgi:hypothetical protein
MGYFSFVENGDFSIGIDTVKKQKDSGGRGRSKNTDLLNNVFFVHATIKRDGDRVQQAMLS